MAEDLTDVYDIVFPSPPNLEEIVSATIALQLWRHEVESHRVNNALDGLDLWQNLSPTNSTLDVQSKLRPQIEKYVKQIGISIHYWQQRHSEIGLFKTGRRQPNLFRTEILNNFNAFVTDFDGSIHYARTAKRIVMCDRIDEVLRFKIACTYCFEDDILRIWPLVSPRIELNRMSFFENLVLYYWVCRLRDQLDELPRPAVEGQSIEEQICRNDRPLPWSALVYFGNRLNRDTQMAIITNPPASFHRYYRYFLRNLDETKLDEFAKTKGVRVLSFLLYGGVGNPFNETRATGAHYISEEVLDRTPYITAFWRCLIDKMTQNSFYFLVEKIIRESCNSPNSLFTSTSTCCELWNMAPVRLKSNVARNLLLVNSLFQGNQKNMDASFLFSILSDASAEDRSAFWDRYWSSLIDLMSAEQFNRLIRLCFSYDENKIVEFKLNSLSEFSNIQKKCSRLLDNLLIEELNEFLSFCCPDEQKRRNIRRTLLLQFFNVNVWSIINVSTLLNDFINDSYEDASLAAGFKTDCLLSPSTLANFKEFLHPRSFGGSFHHVIRFIDTLAPSQQVALDVKKISIIPILQEVLHDGYFIHDFRDDGFLNFLRACLGSDEEIAQFKRNLMMDEIIQNAIRNSLDMFNALQYNSDLVGFLEWYFVTPQALEEFKSRYADNDMFLQLVTK